MPPPNAVIVADGRVALAAPAREEFVERWPLFNDPLLSMALGAPAAPPDPGARAMPPVLRGQREALYEAHVARDVLIFEIRLTEDGRCVGEAYLAGVAWPRASADAALLILSPDDRRRGLGTEAARLLCAYAFDGLGLNRLTARFPSDNVAAVAAMRRAAPGSGAREVGIERHGEWAFGRHVDAVCWELLREEFPPHPATEELRQPPTSVTAQV